MLARPEEVIAPNPMSASSVDSLIQRLGQLRSFKRHSLIYSPGDPSSQIYLISEGEVKLSRYTPEGRELTLDHLNAGSIFGEMEILLGKVRESQALARTDLLLHAMDQESLLSVMETDPHFCLSLTRQMGARQARMETRLESLLFKSANGKVAQVLFNLAHEYGQGTEEGTVINYSITHQEIGNLIATTRETVSYAFMEFRQKGLISTRQRQTIVHDMDGLGDMALN